MTTSASEIDVYLEIGKKKTFAGAVEWPGWSRSGRDEASALQALFDYGPRYGRVLSEGGIDFQPPAATAAFTVVERLEGNATTDFGAPGIAPSSDARPVSEEELRWFQELLRACWRAFDTATEAAVEKELRKGPRGGGRELEGIVRHVLDAEAGYLRQLGWSFKQAKRANPAEEVERMRPAVLEGVAAAAAGELPARGPRGGLRWTPRYFVRRAAWHVLDHLWEIEDRIM